MSTEQSDRPDMFLDYDHGKSKPNVDPEKLREMADSLEVWDQMADMDAWYFWGYFYDVLAQMKADEQDMFAGKGSRP